MWLSPPLILIFLRILTSVLLVLSSPSLLVSWVGLELNTIAFLPLIVIEKSKISREASIKYFLTQTLASVLIIAGGVSLFLNIVYLSRVLVVIGLCIKLGAAPFHSWVLSVAECVGWGALYVLLTVQKINPLIIIWAFSEDFSAPLACTTMLSLLVGGIMGLTQTSARMLITFSSINHVGWLLAGFSLSMWVGVCYFSIYLITLFPVISILNTFNISYINEFFLLNMPAPKQTILFLSFLSLGGLPPFLGFLPKWVVLNSVLGGGLYVISLLIIVTSLFILFYYLRMAFSAFILGGIKTLSVTGIGLTSGLALRLLSLSLGGLPLFLYV